MHSANERRVNDVIPPLIYWLNPDSQRFLSKITSSSPGTPWVKKNIVKFNDMKAFAWIKCLYWTWGPDSCQWMNTTQFSFSNCKVYLHNRNLTPGRCLCFSWNRGDLPMFFFFFKCPYWSTLRGILPINVRILPDPWGCDTWQTKTKMVQPCNFFTKSQECTAKCAIYSRNCS